MIKPVSMIVALAALVSAAPAQAQLRLPLSVPMPVPLPALPLGPAQQTVGTLESDAGIDPADLRRLQIGQLLRRNRKQLEPDPHGDPVVRNEVLASFPDARGLARALALGFTVVRELASVGLRVVVLRTPPHQSTRAALSSLGAAVPDATVDYDHLYLGAGQVSEPEASPATAGPGTPPAVAASPQASPDPLAVRIGLVDSGVDPTHPVFRGSDIRAWGCGGRTVPAAHGTAVASLLLRRAPAELYAADVYCDEPTGGALDTIIAALGWLADGGVPVINLSLVGPANRLLGQVVAALIARGVVIVAAVGNDGPAAPPLYPAAYPGVVGVTAVDAHRRVLLEAEQGPQVMFAAQGADLEAANLQHGTAAVRGTSFAAPTVAALAAARLRAPSPADAADALHALIGQAADLGAPGRDPVFGYGLLGAD